jgi:3-methyladenine DNA glycosylase/8-oxoguanine DNA glycosylase
LRFQARDPQSVCEQLTTDGRLLKGMVLGGQAAMLELAPQGGSVVCLIGNADQACVGSAAIVAEAAAATARLLGLTLDPAPFEAKVADDPLFAPLRPLVAARPGLRIPQTATVWEGAAWAIIGQQINLPFAYHLRREMVRRAGTPLRDGLFAFPTAAQVAMLDYDELTAVKYSRRKAEYLIDTARLIADGTLPCETFPDLDPADVQGRLLAVRGIGPWSANYVAMRACSFADCVPLGDTGLTSGLQRLFGLDHRPGPTETADLMAAFAPYRSFATFHIWQAGGGAA